MNQPQHFADRLTEAIQQKGAPVCVGLDPNLDLLPEEFAAESPAETLESLKRWCRKIIDLVAPHVPAIKPQIAYFESLPAPTPFGGLAVYADAIQYAQQAGLVVIGDAKRGDIGSTATAYAAAHLRNDDSPDALTVNAYFGADGLMPFVQAGDETGRGCFALVRTSNPTGKTIQNFRDAEGKYFYEHIAEQVAEIGAACVGQRGYSCLGAVVGATCPAEAQTLRKLMPQQIFLVPGYGAQGATAQDCAASFKPDGTGAIVNASRSVLYAHRRDEYASLHWTQAVETAAKAFATDIAGAVGK